jgi:predicted phage-related endonuclease
MTVERLPVLSREQWLQWRRQDITASNVGGLFGAHPYTTALRIYAEKRGVEFDDEDNKAMRRGRWLEPAVGKAVSEIRPEWRVEPAAVYLRDPELRLGATPDFFIYGDPRGLGVLQAKSVAPHIFARDWDHGRDVPLWIVLQATCEMMLADAAFGAVAVLTVDPFNMDVAILEVPRNPSAELKIVGAVMRFWQMVEAGNEPEPDFARDADVIKALRPREAPGKSVDFSGDNQLPILLETRAQLRADMAAAEARCGQIEAELRFRMGDAETATGLDGWRLTYKTTDRAGYTVPPKTLRILRIQDKRPLEQRPEADA